ncbi:MAG: hypothetical protein HIU84_09935 [Acidobacteria bacterium]|nr:hypothetical protein [Acidobacteriota bacterium]
MVLPCATLWLVFRVYYLWIFLGVVLTNLVVRLGRIAVRYAAKHIEQHNQVVLLRTARKHEAMFYFVQPSTFTLRFSQIDGEELAEKTYIDDLAHPVAAVLLFFDPFAMRHTPPDGLIAKGIYLGFRALAGAVAMLWILGWFLVVLLGVSMRFSYLWPYFIAQYLPLTARTLWALGSAMLVWTVLWGCFTIWLWRRDRFTVTDSHYAVTSRRMPFEIGKAPAGALVYLQTVTPHTTFLGMLFGYCHLTFDSWMDPEPIEERRFVKHPERASVILKRFTNANAKAGKTPLKA